MSAPRRSGWLVLVATVVGIVLTANLGAWQLRRAASKIALQEALDSRGELPALGAADLATTAAEAAGQHYRRIRVRGRWDAVHTVYLENRQMNARVGFYVVTPLRLSTRSEAVLVQRGWVPRNLLDRTALPPIQTPTDEVEVAGRIAPPPSRLFEFAPSPATAIRQNIDLAALGAETGLPLLPMSIQQLDPLPPSTAAADGLLRQWPRPAVDVQMHYGYAFQWFALSALIAGLHVWFRLVRPRLRRPG